MKVLFLGPETSGIYKYLSMVESDLLSYQAPVSETFGADIIVSHGYRYKVPDEVLAQCPAINCHISFLPWNRGADPNLWSWVNATPQGVTIHLMTERIDSGPILHQRQVTLDENGTLRTTYDHLQREMLRLFAQNWPIAIPDIIGWYPPADQWIVNKATDRSKVAHLLTEGWDTPVKKLIGALKAA